MQNPGCHCSLLSIILIFARFWSVSVEWAGIVWVKWWVRRGLRCCGSGRSCGLVIWWRLGLRLGIVWRRLWLVGWWAVRVVWDVRLMWVVWVVRLVRDVWVSYYVTSCIRKCAPLHCDWFLDHFWAVQLGVAKLLWHRFADFPLMQVGYETSHNLAVSSWLKVTVFFRFHHGGVNVLVKAFLWPCE